MIDIQNKAIADFLDAVDKVLNSNTFLLDYIPTHPTNVQLSLANYLKSDAFQTEIIQQDFDREWYNMHFFDETSNCYKPNAGNLLKPDFHLQLKELPATPRNYLIGMLRADSNIGNFFSAYGKQKSNEDAAKLTDAFLTAIFLQELCEAFMIHPDFLNNANNLLNGESEVILYFEGETGCDSATLFCLPQRHFLLLTNGID